jgi:hypothetical protein
LAGHPVVAHRVVAGGNRHTAGRSLTQEEVTKRARLTPHWRASNCFSLDPECFQSRDPCVLAGADHCFVFCRASFWFSRTRCARNSTSIRSILSILSRGSRGTASIDSGIRLPCRRDVSPMHRWSEPKLELDRK